MKDSKQRLFEIMNKVAGMPLNENNAFNDAGEPLMTHQQYNAYNEPSEEEYNDNNKEYDDYDFKSLLKRDLKNNDILLESYDGKEYFIRCKTNYDYNIYFIGDDIKIMEYDYSKNGDRSQTFNNYDEALKYILNDKDMFLTYAESEREINQEYDDDAADKRTNSMESGSWK